MDLGSRVFRSGISGYSSSPNIGVVKYRWPVSGITVTMLRSWGWAAATLSEAATLHLPGDAAEHPPSSRVRRRARSRDSSWWVTTPALAIMWAWIRPFSDPVGPYHSILATRS